VRFGWFGCEHVCVACSGISTQSMARASMTTVRSEHSLSIRCFACCAKAVHQGTLHCRTGVCAVELLLVPVTTSGLVNHGNIVCSSFIMLDISSIHKVKLSIIHQLAHQVFCGLSLFPPPTCKERLQTTPFWVPLQ